MLLSCEFKDWTIISLKNTSEDKEDRFGNILETKKEDCMIVEFIDCLKSLYVTYDTKYTIINDETLVVHKAFQQDVWNRTLRDTFPNKFFEVVHNMADAIKIEGIEEASSHHGYTVLEIQEM